MGPARGGAELGSKKLRLSSLDYPLQSTTKIDRDHGAPRRCDQKVFRGSAGFPTPVLYVVSDGDCT